MYRLLCVFRAPTYCAASRGLISPLLCPKAPPSPLQRPALCFLLSSLLRLCARFTWCCEIYSKRRRQCKKARTEHLQRHFSTPACSPLALSARITQDHPWKSTNIWIVDWVLLFPFEYEALCTTSSLLGHARDVAPSFSPLIKVTETSRGSHPCKHKGPFQEMALPLC